MAVKFNYLIKIRAVRSFLFDTEGRPPTSRQAGVLQRQKNKHFQNFVQPL